MSQEKPKVLGMPVSVNSFLFVASPEMPRYAVVQDKGVGH